MDITCPTELPFDVDNRDQNLLLLYKAEDFSNCAKDASNLIKEGAKYFFWSFNANPFGKPGGSNCVVYKYCDERELVDLLQPGYTYRLCPSESNGKYKRCC